MREKITAHIAAVIKGILFIGFSIRIILGVIWMCCNFASVQDFGAPETWLYGGLYRLTGECAPVMYSLQLAAVLAAGYFFLQELMPVGRIPALWRSLVLLTFSFGLQCHMAVQPHSLVASGMMLMFAFLIRGIRQSNKRKKSFLLALGCLILSVLFSGALDSNRIDLLSRRGTAGILAGRLAWPTLIQDYEYWSPDLQELVQEVWWESVFAPDNMNLMLDAIEEQVGTGQAEIYYEELGSTAWDYHAPMIIRQLGWDFLGYVVTPMIVPMQLMGDAYDSYTGRNYEIMRGECPILTKHYVNYDCWWFVISFIGAAFLGGAHFWNCLTDKSPERKRSLWNGALAVCACALICVVWLLLLVFRGAGMMDYKWSIAVNELWQAAMLLLMGKVWKTW